MKILYLCPDLGIPVLGPKGAAVHVRSLIAAFARAGQSVVLAASVLTKSPWEEPATVEASLLHLPPAPEDVAAVRAFRAFNETLGVTSSLPGELRSILQNRNLLVQLGRRFDRHPPDFIYERAALYATAGAALARELGVPRLVEVNAPLALEHAAYRGLGFGELASQAEGWALAQADAVLAVSAPLRDHVVSLGVPPERAHVLPNGVDTALFRPGPPDPAVRARWGLGEGPVVGFVGGLRPWHGLEAVPALLDRLLPDYPNLRLVIAGDGPLRAELEQRLRERAVARSVVFTGSVPHTAVPALIRQFDVALAPYSHAQHLWYASSLKLLEYMACGRPVVAARLGQIPEVVRDGETGLLYPPDEPEALAAACDRLLADGELRRRLGEAAAREIDGRYSWSSNAARIVELARPLVEARAAAG